MKSSAKKNLRLCDTFMNKYFDKLYHFKNAGWSLPTEVYAEPKWLIDELQEKKQRLNAVKEQLSSFDLTEWSSHTKNTDPSTEIIKYIRKIIKPELLTQAWCKFYECLSRFDLIPQAATYQKKLNTFHLCEAPGGFISALNHFLRIHHPMICWDWQATTLNPEYEGNPLNRMIPDDRLIKFTRDKWLFGADYTGDITKFYNHEYLLKAAGNKCLLVTADGSIQCMDDPGDQERLVERLHYCELITALAMLAYGGTLVLKIFTVFEESTVCLVYLLNCCFESVSLFKPVTSKSGNSETYLLCRNYIGLQFLAPIWPQLLTEYRNPSKDSMFKLSDLPRSFLDQIDQATELFMQKQMLTINDNIKYFHSKQTEFDYEDIINYFLNECFIKSIKYKQRLVSMNNVHRRSLSKEDRLYPFKMYSSNRQFRLNVKIGKSITNVFYSKYCSEVVLPKLCRNRKKRQTNTLYSLAKSKLSQYVTVIDQTDFDLENFALYQRNLFSEIRGITKDVIFINVPIITNFLAGLFNIICSAFCNSFFFPNGVVWMVDFHRPHVIKTMCDNIDEWYSKLSKCDDFDSDLIELIDVDNRLLPTLWLYNNDIERYRTVFYLSLFYRYQFNGKLCKISDGINMNSITGSLK